AFLDGALLQIEVLHGGEPLDSLRRKIAVRHGVSNDHRPLALPAQLCRDQSRNRALAASRSHRTHGNDGDRGFELRVLGSQKPEIGVCSHRTGAEMHEVLVGNIAIGKHYRINRVFSDQVFQIFLFEDRNALRIQAAGQFRRITTAGNVGNLSGSERNYLVVGIITKYDVEIVEVPAGGTQNQNSLHGHTSSEDRYLVSSRLLAAAAVPFVTSEGDF